MERKSGVLLLIILIHSFVRGKPPAIERVMLLDTILDDWRGWSTNSGRYSGWRSQNIPPNGDRVFGLCMVMRENNDNWLYSPIIPTGEANSVIIETFFSMRNCKNYPEPSKLKSCEEKINMLTFETDEIKESTIQNNKLFKQTAVLFPEKKWSQLENEQPVMNANKVTFPIKTLGIQISYRDTGSCTMIRRVRVYYLVCPNVITSFMEFPRTVTKHGYDLASAQGICVSGAILKHIDEIQSRFCQSNGMWHDMGMENCQCAPGYTPSNDWKSCIPCAKGTYKQNAGMDRCSYCPKYSRSEPGQIQCRCDKDLYRKIIKSGSLTKTLCLQPPSAPERIKANIVDGYAVILTWHYPDFINALKLGELNFFHVSCSKCTMERLMISPSVNVTQLNVTVVGLNMGENYLFYVTTISLDSNYSKSSLINPFRSTIYFSLPKTNGISMNPVKIDVNKNESISIAWIKPANIPVYQYMLQICTIYAITENTLRNECEYFFLQNNNYIYYCKAICIEIKVRLRFKSKSIWSDYSMESSLKLINKENLPSKVEVSDRMSVKTYSLFPSFPNLEVVLLFLTSGILILILITVSAALMRRHIYNTLKQDNSIRLSDTAYIDNSKSSYTSVTASSPSRARSYFYLSSVDNSISQSKTLNEIPQELMIMKTLYKKGMFYDIYNACLKQPRKLPLNVTLYILISKPEVSKSLLEIIQETFQFQHENIVSIIGISFMTMPQIIVLENMAHGSLNSFLKRYNSAIDRSQLVQFLRDIACGLCYLAERQFIIKKLSSHMVYVQDSLVCKLSICLLEWNNETQSNDNGNNETDIGWKAPELYSQNIPTIQSDVWAFGIVIWEVFAFGETPYWNWTADVIKQSVLGGFRLSPSINCLPAIHELMSQCCMTDSCQRPPFSLILTKIDQVLNYVDNKIMSSQKQKLIVSTDKINSIDPSLPDKNLKSQNNRVIKNTFTFSENIKDTSMENITDRNLFYSLKLKKEFSAKKSRSLRKISAFPESKTLNNKIMRKVENLNKSSFQHSILQKHIKGNKVNLNNWLTEINMKKYKSVMTKNGYHNKLKLINLTIADLTEMGIKNASEIQIIINNIQHFKVIESQRV